jgi:hypothetical protein
MEDPPVLKPEVEYRKPANIREVRLAYGYEATSQYLKLVDPIEIGDIRLLLQSNDSQIRRMFTIGNDKLGNFFSKESYVNLCTVVLPYMRSLERKLVLHDGTKELSLAKVRVGIKLLEQLSESPLELQVVPIPDRYQPSQDLVNWLLPSE